MKKGYLKLHLTLAINRLKMAQAKKASLRQTARRGISELLAAGKEESARIRVEQIIREDFLVESMEIVELYCELLVGRFALLDQKSKKLDVSLVEPIMTIIYAAPRMEIKELLEAREEFIFKFGKEFANLGVEDKMKHVNPKIVQKLSTYTPDPYLVEQYLKEIAKFFDVSWEPSHPAAPPSARGPLIDARAEGNELKGLQGFPTMTPYQPTEGSLAVSPTLSGTASLHLAPEQEPCAQHQSSNAARSPLPTSTLSFSAVPLPGLAPPATAYSPSLSSYQHYMPPHYAECASSSTASMPPPRETDRDEKKPWTADRPPATASTSSTPPQGPGSGVPDFDDLAKRFEALKKGRP